MPRPAIPTTVKREIRRRCAYGCVVCGCPIYEYHHINGYDEDVGHIEIEITLLCDKCHRKEQNALISRDEVLRWDANPFNRQQGRSSPERFWYARGECEVWLGDNVVHVAPGAVFSPLVLDGKSIIRLSPDPGAADWQLSMQVLDPWHQPILDICDNQLVYRIAELDVEIHGGPSDDARPPPSGRRGRLFWCPVCREQAEDHRRNILLERHHLSRTLRCRLSAEPARTLLVWHRGSPLPRGNKGRSRSSGARRRLRYAGTNSIGYESRRIGSR